MNATRPLLAKGFIGRSIDEFKRITISGKLQTVFRNRKATADRRCNTAINQEGITGHNRPLPLLDLRDPETRKQCKTISDADTGGFSKVNLDFIPKDGQNPAHARFHGSISTELPHNRPNIQRSGYAAWRSLDRPPTIFGKSLWNIDPYTYLGLRVKSDGRKYFVNVMTETIVPTDIHQHRLYTRQVGEWETVVIKWNEFVRTNHGLVVEPQTEMLRQRVKSIGIGLIDRVNGPYDLSIGRIWATNDPDGGLLDEDGREAQSSPKVEPIVDSAGFEK